MIVVGTCYIDTLITKLNFYWATLNIKLWTDSIEILSKWVNLYSINGAIDPTDMDFLMCGWKTNQDLIVIIAISIVIGCIILVEDVKVAITQ